MKDGDSDQAIAPNGEAQERKHEDEVSRAGNKGLLVDELARLPEKSMLDQARLANVLRVKPRTIRRMVSRHELPPAIKLAGRSIWFAGRVVSHIEAAAERAERDAEKHARKIRELSP